MYRDPEPLRKNEILELVARHRRQPDADPARWSDALAAMDRDASIRDAALAVDPLLLFHEMEEVEVDAHEVAEMKRSVRELRHSREIESALEPGRTTSRNTSRGFSRGAGLRSWRLAAALAVLLLGASLLLPSARGPELRGPEPGVQEAAGIGAPQARNPVSETALDAAQLPLVEDLDGSKELIQIESAELSVVVASLPPDFEI